jgi:hypothetical protein
MWCLQPVIPATLEVELRRIALLGWLRQNVHETPSQPMTELSDVYLSCQLCREAQIGESQTRPPGIKQDSISKIKRA